ncbi:MAG: DNA primase [Bacilli bacterium]|nr:DNA primase [Bacilli bacterium]
MANSKIDFDELRKKIDIVKVIEQYIPLTKRGKNYVGLCPFHQDSNPSLTVSPEKQIYKCFVCNAAGNVFTFVKDKENIPFLDAVKRTCELAGIDDENVNKIGEHKVIDNSNAKLYKVLSDVNDYYVYQLKTLEGKVALDYLKGRGINEKNCIDYNIGFSGNDGKKAINYLLEKGHSLDDIVLSGIGLEHNGDVYDRMSGRVTFAITDDFNRVVGFSGRKINDKLEQKYINTPETLIFHKGEILYNYYNCSKVCRREGYLYVVEGFMDVLALLRCGIENVVATMGTALTSVNINKLKSLNCEVRLMLDSDNAGQKAIYDALSLIGTIIKKIKVVEKFIDVKDVDELLTNHGCDELKNKINLLINAFDFKINYLSRKYNLENYEDRKLFAIDSAKLLDRSQIDDIDLDHYIKIIEEKSKISRNSIMKYVPNTEKSTKFDFSKYKIMNGKQKKYIDKYDAAERQIINMAYKDAFTAMKLTTYNFSMYNDINRRIFSYIMDYYDNREIEVNNSDDSVVADIISEMPNDIKNEFLSIIDDEYPPEDLENLIKIIKDDRAKKINVDKLMEQMNDLSNPVEMAKLAKEKILKEGILFNNQKKSKKK